MLEEYGEGKRKNNKSWLWIGVCFTRMEFIQRNKEDELDNAKVIYDYETSKRAYTEGGFEKAIYDYMTLQDNFDEEDGIFVGINGYSIQN